MPRTSARKAGPQEPPRRAQHRSSVTEKTATPRKRPKKVQQKPRVLSAPVYRGAIPRVEGPKLSEFPYRGATINFRALLSDPDAEGQAHVFEFKFYDDAEDDFGLWPEEQEIVSLDLLHAHSDPFYNECRAYGKLIETNLNGKVAVRCHGYTTLPAAIEEELEERFDVSDWDREDYDRPMRSRAVFRAIVKDLVKEDIPLTTRVLRRMKKDLKEIRKQGVYPTDVKARNYKGGLLVDFSTAMTEPHYLFEIMPDWRVKTYQNEDLFEFDAMVEDEEVKTTVRAMPNPHYLRKLRSRDYLQKKYKWPRSPHVHLSV
ncbi:MAG: hypothetical protein Q9195_008658 [Heterodermia aff. obscurata]